MPSAFVAARNVYVWLPPSYGTDPQKRYPVVYMHDGQNLFDPATSYGNVDWAVDEVMTRLIEQGQVREAIVVGVWNSPKRREEYMPQRAVQGVKKLAIPGRDVKAADIIGLYINPPQHAAVFCGDEKTAIQALDRLDPVLPLSPGRAERHVFEYFRHGTLSLYAALNTRTGAVIGRTAPRHTSAEFVAFLADLVASQSPRREIHVIADNLSAHKTKLVQAFLRNNPRVHIHYTPTYSSWLNQVQLWLSKIERDVIARGIFTSVADLRRKLMRYIRHYNRAPKPIKWMYRDPTNRFTGANSAVTVH